MKLLVKTKKGDFELSAKEDKLFFFESIIDDVQVNIEPKKLSHAKSLTIILGNLPNNIIGYNVYLNGKLKHHNHSGVFVNNEKAKKHIKEGFSPVIEDAFQWIEEHYGDVIGSFGVL